MRWDAARARSRQELHTRLEEVLPRHDEIRERVRAHQANQFGHLRPPLPVFQPPLVPLDPDLTVFTPPFSQERLGPLTSGWVDTMGIVERSFARREIGHIVVDADLSVDPVWTTGLNELFDVVPLHSAWLSAGCGTTFTLPADGRLHVFAALRNFYSRVVLSLRDKWGLSDGRLGADVTLFIAVFRPDAVEALHSLVSERTLVSDGDDVSRELPDIEQRQFRLLATTEGLYQAGETVSVLAGVSLRAGSALNDMMAHVRPLLWWGLEELRVGVV